MVRLYGFILIASLLLGGCTPDPVVETTLERSYSSSIIISLNWMDGFSFSSGFYRLVLLRPDGSAVEGIEERQVDYLPGDVQKITLALRNEVLFENNDSVLLRLFVEAIPGVGQSPVASGSAPITFENNGDSQGAVDIYADPRPLDSAMLTGSFGSAADPEDDERGRLLSLRWLSAPPEQFSYHLWQINDGTPSHLRKLDVSSISTLLIDTTDNLPLLDSNVTFVVTAEAGDIAGPLTAPLGWKVYEGSGPRESDRSIIGSAREMSADLFALIEQAQKHTGFAAASLGNESSVLGHTEHVWNYLVGEAHPLTADEDFNASGVKEYPSGDRTGIHAYLSQLNSFLDVEFESLEIAEADPTQVAEIVLRLNACTKNLENTSTATTHDESAVGRVLGVIPNYQTNFGDESAADAMVAASDDLSGDTYDASAQSLDGMPRQTGRCIENRVEALSTFVFSNRSAGDDG